MFLTLLEKSKLNGNPGSGEVEISVNGISVIDMIISNSLNNLNFKTPSLCFNKEFNLESFRSTFSTTKINSMYRILKFCRSANFDIFFKLQDR